MVSSSKLGKSFKESSPSAVVFEASNCSDLNDFRSLIILTSESFGWVISIVSRESAGNPRSEGKMSARDLISGIRSEDNDVSPFRVDSPSLVFLQAIRLSNMDEHFIGYRRTVNVKSFDFRVLVNTPPVR
jgi:hypothetical protein